MIRYHLHELGATLISDEDSAELKDTELMARELQAGALTQDRLAYYHAVALGDWQDTPVLLGLDLFDMIQENQGYVDVLHRELPESERERYIPPADPDEPVERINGYFIFLDRLKDLAQPKLTDLCVDVSDATYFIVGQHAFNSPGINLREVTREYRVAMISYRDFMRLAQGNCPQSYLISRLGGAKRDPYETARNLFSAEHLPPAPGEEDTDAG